VTARRASVVALAALLCVLPARPSILAQRLPAPDPVRETPAAAVPAPSPVNIRINAVVTDRRGRPLVDLKPGDFELDDNGISQALASVELRTAPRSAAAVVPVLSAEDERAAAEDPGTRVFAVFLDEFNVAPGAGYRNG
jgi:hypothetical protein